MRTKAIKTPERTTMRLSKRIRDMLKELSQAHPRGMTGVIVALVEKEHRRVKALEGRGAAVTFTGDTHDWQE